MKPKCGQRNFIIYIKQVRPNQSEKELSVLLLGRCDFKALGHVSPACTCRTAVLMNMDIYSPELS